MKCFVIGHSLGGSISIVLATQRPDLVGKLIVAEGNLAPGPEEGSNATFSRSIAAQTEEAFLRMGWQEVLRTMRSVSPAIEGRLRVADPRAV